MLTDFDLHADNAAPKSIWSDGTTLWVGDDTDAEVYAYKLVDDPATTLVDEYGTRDSSKDITPPNPEAFLVTGDGDYLYLAEEALDGTTLDLFVYNLPGLSRASSKDVNHSAFIVRGLATDGEYFWITPTTSQAKAFKLSDGTAVTSRDVTFPGSGQVTGLYTDGTTKA